MTETLSGKFMNVKLSVKKFQCKTPEDNQMMNKARSVCNED